MCHLTPSDGDEWKSIEYCCSTGSHLLFITADFLSSDRSAHICREEIKENRKTGRRAPLIHDFQLFLLLLHVGAAQSKAVLIKEELAAMALLSFTLS